MSLRLHGLHRSRSYPHYHRDRTLGPKDEKEALLKAYAKEKVQTGPLKSTRARKVAAEADMHNDKKVGHLQQAETSTKNSFFSITFHVRKWSPSSIGRTEDGSD